jgi:type IV pilus assembly protein PilW
VTKLQIPRREAGFTIVELMVGVLVGLIATVVMFQVFAVSEAQKRTTTGAGDAQQNGVGSVFLMERDARMAGYSMSYFPLLGCLVNGWYEPANQPFTFRMAPFVIADGGPTPDTVTFAIGDARGFTAPEKLKQDTPDAAAPFYVNNRYGFALGDLMIVTDTGKDCTLYQVSSLPSPGAVDTIGRLPGNFVDVNGLARQTKFNRVGGVPPGTLYRSWNGSTQIGGRLLNIGQNPTVVTYALQGNQLVAIDGLVPGGAPTLISDGIVQFQVQYAFDADGDNSVSSTALNTAVLNPGLGDQWSDALPAAPTTAMWQGIVGIRLAIVSRSMTPEKAKPDGTCDTTTAFPTWLAKGVPLDLSADPLWMCYRYRVFELTVPARNRMWFPNENA